VADHLANEGVRRETEQIIWDARSDVPSVLYNQCHSLASKDYPAPDGVPRVQAEPRGGGMGEAIYNGPHRTYSHL
jgi:hypothetical protein